MKKSLLVFVCLILNIIGFAQTATISDGKFVFEKKGKQYIAAVNFSEAISSNNMPQVQEFLTDNGLTMESKATKKNSVTYHIIAPEHLANIQVFCKFLTLAGVAEVVDQSSGKKAMPLDSFISKSFK